MLFQKKKKKTDASIIAVQYLSKFLSQSLSNKFALISRPSPWYLTRDIIKVHTSYGMEPVYNPIQIK